MFISREYLGNDMKFERKCSAYNLGKETDEAFALNEVMKKVFKTKARFRRRTSHEPNRMLMRENKGFFSFAFDSAHVKYGV